MLEQVPHSGQGGVKDHLVVDQLEDTIRLVQPLWHCHIGIVNGFEIPDEGLEEVMMSVDQAWINKHTAGIEDFVIGVGQLRANFQNSGTVNQQVCIPIDMVLGVTGDNRFRISDQSLHREPP